MGTPTLNMSLEEQAKMLAEFQLMKAKEAERKAKHKAYQEANKDKMALNNLRRRVRMQLLCDKATKQGIVVTEKEINDYIAKNP